jgi:hypothetical protein
MQAANAKLLDALRSRMLDVGASRSANRLPSLQPAGGDSSSPSSAILHNISSQLEVRVYGVGCWAAASCLDFTRVFLEYEELTLCRRWALPIATLRFTRDSEQLLKQM